MNKVSRGLLIAVVLYLVSTANAAPTTITCNSDVGGEVSIYVQHHAGLASKPFLIIKSEVSDFIDVREELAGRPVDFSGFVPVSKFMDVKSLPPTPKPLLMVLIGFVCISLVKDRRAWLSCFAAILWLGQVGFSALPQFAAHLRTGKQSEYSYSQKITDLWWLKDSSPHSSLLGKVNTYLSMPAIISKLLNVCQLLNCLAPKAGQVVSLSPRLSLIQLARGPPTMDLEH